MLYASNSLALAVLEVLVHLAPPVTLDDYRCFSIDIPRTELEYFDAPMPPFEDSQTLGSAFLDYRRAIGLDVPSALLTEGRNVVMNPAHLGWDAVKVSGPMSLTEDPRLRRLRVTFGP